MRNPLTGKISRKRKPDLLDKAQKAFNAYIRERDKNNGCISAYCRGQVEHAGHYFSQGHHSKVRFDEFNVNGQCAHCNTFKHGNLIQYRRGLIAKYGEPHVLLLEDRARGSKTWDRVELLAIIQHYKTLTKDLKDA